MFNKLFILSLAVLLTFKLFAAPSPQLHHQNLSHHVLFLMRSGDTSKALETYKIYQTQQGQHDFELIQEMGLLLLDQGCRNPDAEIRLMTAFGAGISLNERTIYILEAGMDSGIPELQIVSLNFLGQFQNDQADAILQKAMNVAHPLIRLEAAYIMAQKKTPRAYAYAESLMHRYEGPLTSVFPPFFAMIGSKEAIQMLRKLMSNSNEDVRISAILSAAKYGRDDLLPKIRTLATHHEKAQQEACAYALGCLKDEKGISKLEMLAHSKVPHVQWAACKSLYDLGRKEYKAILEKAAKNKDLYAITLLGDIQGSEELLAALALDPNLQVKVNATIALLHLQDSRCLPGLKEILIADHKGLCLSKTSSKGRSLQAWRATPCAKQNFKDDPYIFEASLNMREDLLEAALDLPEKDFLSLAKTIFRNQQNDLIPLLVNLLEQLNTPGAIDLLKQYQQQVGAPLIRNYCNLALYNLKEKGPYGENIRTWISQMHHEELIRFRPFLPRELREDGEPYKLTPQDNSSLLIASFESFVSNKDENGIDVLLDAIQNGHAKNKYALAGLLMRAIH